MDSLPKEIITIITDIIADTKFISLKPLPYQKDYSTVYKLLPEDVKKYYRETKNWRFVNKRLYKMLTPQNQLPLYYSVPNISVKDYINIYLIPLHNQHFPKKIIDCTISFHDGIFLFKNIFNIHSVRYSDGYNDDLFYFRLKCDYEVTINKDKLKEKNENLSKEYSNLKLFTIREKLFTIRQMYNDLLFFKNTITRSPLKETLNINMNRYLMNKIAEALTSQENTEAFLIDFWLNYIDVKRSFFSEIGSILSKILQKNKKAIDATAICASFRIKKNFRQERFETLSDLKSSFNNMLTTFASQIQNDPFLLNELTDEYNSKVERFNQNESFICGTPQALSLYCAFPLDQLLMLRNTIAFTIHVPSRNNVINETQSEEENKQNNNFILKKDIVDCREIIKKKKFLEACLWEPCLWLVKVAGISFFCGFGLGFLLTLCKKEHFIWLLKIIQ